MLALARDAWEEKRVIDEEKKQASTAEAGETDVQQVDSQQPDPERLKASLAEKEEEIRCCTDRLKRLQAEFENYKKRMQREAGSIEERISDREILDLLPLFDNMERAFASYSGNNDAASFIEGIERIFAQFSQILRQKGIAPIDALGQRFDPAKHEALLSVESEGAGNTVLEEFERGYVRSGRLLRPSKVKVSRGTSKTEGQSS